MRRNSLPFVRTSIHGFIHESNKPNDTECELLPPLSLLGNYTSSGGKGVSMELLMVFTAVLMAILSATLFVLGLVRLFFGRDTRPTTVRVFLRWTFAIFLPLLSYMFSQAKEKNEYRALLILLWMLLVELIHKKVRATVQQTDESSFSKGVIGRFTVAESTDELARLVWIGYLMYSYLEEHHNDIENKRPQLLTLFVILWSLSVLKLVQRVVNIELTNRSFTAVKNTGIIAGYMQLVAQEHDASTSNNIMEDCKYAVMGEEKLVFTRKEKQDKASAQEAVARILPTPGGYRVKKLTEKSKQDEAHLTDLNNLKGLVTVGTIWRLAAKDELFSNKQLKETCLSFALFKLLRRQFEHYPILEAKLMPKGLLTLESNNANHDTVNARRTFEVIHQELNFLDNYYQAVTPVVMSNPILFVSNFSMSVLFVLTYIVAVLAMTWTRSILYDFFSSFGSIHSAMCFLKKALATMVISSLDLIITILLMIALLAIDCYEFFSLYLFSDWFLVRLICFYARTPTWRNVRLLRWAIKASLFVKSWRRAHIKIHQVSILHLSGPPVELWALASKIVRSRVVGLPPVRVTPEVKVAIVKSLNSILSGDRKAGLPDLNGLDKRSSTTEIILMGHLATSLIEIRRGRQMKSEEDRKDRNIATSLSRYCMYLVVYAPTLLPDDTAWTAEVYEETRRCLRQFKHRGMTSSSRWDALMAPVLDLARSIEDPVTRQGVEVFKQLKQEACVWQKLAKFWVDLLIYLSPSDNVEGHAKALATCGGEFITYLWAFCSHADIVRRQPPDEPTSRQEV